jgi:hypothetical protein
MPEVNTKGVLSHAWAAIVSMRETLGGVDYGLVVGLMVSLLEAAARAPVIQEVVFILRQTRALPTNEKQAHVGCETWTLGRVDGNITNHTPQTPSNFLYKWAVLGLQ